MAYLECVFILLHWCLLCSYQSWSTWAATQHSNDSSDLMPLKFCKFCKTISIATTWRKIHGLFWPENQISMCTTYYEMISGNIVLKSDQAKGARVPTMANDRAHGFQRHAFSFTNSSKWQIPRMWGIRNSHSMEIV